MIEPGNIEACTISDKKESVQMLVPRAPSLHHTLMSHQEMDKDKQVKGGAKQILAS